MLKLSGGLATDQLVYCNELRKGGGGRVDQRCQKGRCIESESFLCGAIVDGKKKVMKKQRRSKKKGWAEKGILCRQTRSLKYSGGRQGELTGVAPEGID
jgi:hypothetical protein